MPDLLGATNPVPSYDAPSVKITPPVPGGDANIQNVVDPDRVTRPDGQEGQQGAGDATSQFQARFDSNFMTFLQRLRGAQELPEIFLTVLQGQQVQVTSGIQSGFAEEMAQFLEFIHMDEGQMLSFLQNQAQSGSRFSGALFQMLRNAFNGTTSELTKNDILQFVRRYGDYTSTEHIEDNLVRMTDEMTEALPGKWSAELTQVLAQLENGVAAGDREGNLKLLREQVFPLVSKYVSLTHDHGLARNLLSAMTLDVARYENGSQDGLLQAFRHLANSEVLPKEIAELPDSELLRMLKETDFQKASDANVFADRMARVTHRALQGEDGVNTQDAFHNIMNSVLINESVYMPLQHIMLPLNWNGELMFSELWIDPDAERDQRRPDGKGDNGPVQRVLIKMDIRSLGAFDVLIQNRSEGVSMLVTCPKSVAEQTAQVTQSLRDILARNGLKVEQVQVAEQHRPLTVSQVFPKLAERMSGVNVKV
ncbi:MAG: flagellar hook-length control protein FliK [Ruminococcaceae bacterium]|nr:flagellar hook-length control protein FliK [Oscillospiraceae bacterium]